MRETSAARTAVGPADRGDGGLARPEPGGVPAHRGIASRGLGPPSSAALSVALAEVFGVTGPPPVIARLCQEAERRSGVPVGAMDPLVCAGGVGDTPCSSISHPRHRVGPGPVRCPTSWSSSGRAPMLSSSPYAARVAECEAAPAPSGHWARPATPTWSASATRSFNGPGTSSPSAAGSGVRRALSADDLPTPGP